MMDWCERQCAYEKKRGVLFAWVLLRLDVRDWDTCQYIPLFSWAEVVRK